MSSPDTLDAGKLPAALLASLLAEYVKTDDPSVLVAPAPGHDAAVVRPGDDIIVKSDPITFATSSPATYLVAVNANDIACLGGTPKWLAVTALFPAGKTTAHDVSEVFRELAEACARIGVTLIGGHTEVSPGVRRTMLSGTMIGLPAEHGILQPGGAQPGDHLYLTQAAGIEGTSIIATEAPPALLEGIPEASLMVARDLLSEPGISIVEAARTARHAAPITAMHDPTEGGVATAIHELADAAGIGFEIDVDQIPIWPVTRDLTERFGISPLGLLSSGALLFTAPPDADTAIIDSFAGTDIPVTRIGRMSGNADNRIARSVDSQRELPRYDADEITRVFAMFP